MNRKPAMTLRWFAADGCRPAAFCPDPFRRGHSPRTTTRVAVLLGATVVLALATACEKGSATPPTEVEVQAASAETAPITQHLTVDGVLAPLAQASISPKITAPVRKFYVQRGSRVKAGQLLATLENRDLNASLMDNRGSFESAEATYQTTVKAQVPQDYQRAELDVAQALASLKLNQKIVESRRQLFAQGAIPGRDLDTAEAALVDAQANYDSAAKRLAGVKQVSHEAALKNASGQLESAQGKYQAAEAQLSYSEIRSPISGVVTDRPLFAGETATTGTPLITLMETSALLVKAHVPQSALATVKRGDKADVFVSSLNRTVDGEITLISPALDPGSTTVEIWVLVKNPAGELRPGTAVRVSIAGRTVQKALLVPSQAIVTTKDGKKAVMLIDSGGVAHQTIVTTGIEDGGNTQIVKGLSPGGRVVTAGAYALDDGTHVKVVSASESDAGASKE
jgi:HlyD family secretion protein